MEFIQSIQGIIAVSILVILDLFAVVKVVKTIVTKSKALSKEEQQDAKAAVIGNLRQIIFGLVTDAEKELGGGTGKLKSAKVAGWIYDKIPDELKPLFTAEEIQEMIDAVLQEAQEYWEKNGKAREYIESGAATLLTAEVEAINPPAGLSVDEIVRAVGDRIGDAIVKASETASAGHQDGSNDTPDNSPTQGHPTATETAEGAASGEIPQT